VTAKKKRLPSLRTAQGTAQALQRVIRESYRGELDQQHAARLGDLLFKLAKIHQTESMGDLERLVEILGAELKRRTP